MTGILELLGLPRRKHFEARVNAIMRREIATMLPHVSDEKLVAVDPPSPSVASAIELEMARRLNAAIALLTAEAVDARKSSERLGHLLILLTVALVIMTAVLVALTVMLAVRG
jgi:CRP-like cAMP-binding protein